MKAIGGFFELETCRGNNRYHKNAVTLCTGRACLNLILNIIKPKKIYVPYYTCDALLQPLIKNNINFESYSINEVLEPGEKINLRKNEYIIYINYFGICGDKIPNLLSIYSNRLIIDNSQAFFEKKYDDNFSFNSARKFFGVPDGAYLYSPKKLKLKINRNPDIKYDYLIERSNGFLNEAYSLFRSYENSLTPEIKKISLFSEKILSGIDYEKSQEIRNENFALYHKELSKYNRLIFNINSVKAPLCYPFFPKTEIERDYFYNQKVFIPQFWKEVLNKEKNKFLFEKELSKKLLPLPIDHRYSKRDINRVIELILKKI